MNLCPLLENLENLLTEAERAEAAATSTPEAWKREMCEMDAHYAREASTAETLRVHQIIDSMVIIERFEATTGLSFDTRGPLPVACRCGCLVQYHQNHSCPRTQKPKHPFLCSCSEPCWITSEGK